MSSLFEALAAAEADATTNPVDTEAHTTVVQNQPAEAVGEPYTYPVTPESAKLRDKAAALITKAMELEKEAATKNFSTGDVVDAVVGRANTKRTERGTIVGIDGRNAKVIIGANDPKTMELVTVHFNSLSKV